MTGSINHSFTAPEIAIKRRIVINQLEQFPWKKKVNWLSRARRRRRPFVIDRECSVECVKGANWIRHRD